MSHAFVSLVPRPTPKYKGKKVLDSLTNPEYTFSMENEWIALEDRLPEENGKYMIRAYWGAINPRKVEEPALFKIRPTGGRFMYGFDWCRITHWKHLK